VDIVKLLTIAGLSDTEKQSALDCLALAKKRKNGLLWHKIKARYFMAGHRRRKHFDIKSAAYVWASGKASRKELFVITRRATSGNGDSIASSSGRTRRASHSIWVSRGSCSWGWSSG